MAKTQVLIIPEVHTDFGQKLIELYAPIIRTIFDKNNIQDVNVLNYTEGDSISNLYSALYKKEQFFQYVSEKTISDDHPDIYHSIKHGLTIINLIRNTFDYYKQIRQSDKTTVPIGLSNLPMDSKYIKILVYDIYMFPTYVLNKKHKYYAYMNEIYKNIINNDSIEKYEEYMTGLLNEAKQFFTDYLQYFNFYEMLDDLTQYNLSTRLSVINKYSAKLRTILDARVINAIPKIVKLHPKINTIIMVCGTSHFYNLSKLINSSETLMMEPEFLHFLLSTYELSQLMGGIPNILTTEDGIVD